MKTFSCKLSNSTFKEWDVPKVFTFISISHNAIFRLCLLEDSNIDAIKLTVMEINIYVPFISVLAQVYRENHVLFCKFKRFWCIDKCFSLKHKSLYAALNTLSVMDKGSLETGLQCIYSMYITWA